MSKAIQYIILSLIGLLPAASFAQAPDGYLHFHFIANGKPVLADSNYVNAFGEAYRITKLKMYISGPVASSLKGSRRNDTYLLDAAVSDSIPFSAATTKLSKVSFGFGVDSALNCSGAQDGALDPLNAMFWTWNSGYIFFKMEGYSPASKADMQRIEQHVGGYKYPFNVNRAITLPLRDTFTARPGQALQVHINVDMDRYWKSINDLKIAHQALLMTPGAAAMKAADNIATMFSIRNVQQN